MAMDLDDLLRRCFGTSNMAEVSPEVQAAGIERLLVDFGLARDRSERFALWSVLYLLGQAPDLDICFKDEDDRNAARDVMDLMAAAERPRP